MAKTIIGFFEERARAQAAVDALTAAGFDGKSISIISQGTATGGAAGTQGGAAGKGKDAAGGAAAGATTGAATGTVVGAGAALLATLGALAIPGFGPILAAGPLVALLAGAGVGAGVGAVAGGLVGGLVKAGVPEEEATFYAEGVKKGGTLVAVSAEEARAAEAWQILSRSGAIDIKGRMAGAGRAQGVERTQVAGRDAGDIRATVVEEELKVGKREIETGGVRVSTRVSERPVEEHVSLREEHVRVERRPVDRPATDADFARGQETIEVREHAEEAVVSKDARVVEEVVIRKEVGQREETVRDTVRRKDVDIVDVVPGRRDERFEQTQEQFQSRHRDGAAGEPFERHAPAYRYGCALSQDKAMAGKEWSDAEPKARQDWEAKNPGTWEQFKDSVRHAWEKVRGEE